ncbi:MAG: L,D-transpeptidase family protein [Rickettsiales bacterium]|nr:L,D-transpeptidase family protein [Rickettsiales bacterium]
MINKFLILLIITFGFSYGAVAVMEQAVNKIVVYKNDRKMFLYNKDVKIKEYDIDLGFDPFGHKQKEGDGKTPEGIYKISGRNPNSSYYLSLRISYPSEQDKLNAKKLGVNPGGDIMIHGLPNKLSSFGFGFLLSKDWTLGCIALKSNKEMKEVWDLVENGTLIEINP